MTSSGPGDSSRTKTGYGNSGHWGQNATDAQRIDNIAHRKLAHTTLVKFFSSLRQTFGGSAEAAENILRVAGFTPDQYGNEPDSNDTRPFAANPITNTHLDDGGAGGNYSGTGRLSSAAPKQVIVNIESLLSVRTIDLMKSKEGQTEENTEPERTTGTGAHRCRA